MRRPRFTVHHTTRGYIVLDELKNLRVRGPFDGPTGKATANAMRDKLEAEAASARARKLGGAR